MYRGIGNNVAERGRRCFFSTDPTRAATFGKLHYVDVIAGEMAKFERPHSERILGAEPIAVNDWRTADPEIIARLKPLEDADQLAARVQWIIDNFGPTLTRTGRLAVQFAGTALGFNVFDEIHTVQPGAIVDNKRLSAVWSRSRRSKPPTRARHQRGHVARQRPPNNLEAPGLPSLDPTPLPPGLVRKKVEVVHRLQHALRPRPGQCRGLASAAGTSR
jgi:hypothetical protein